MSHVAKSLDHQGGVDWAMTFSPRSDILYPHFRMMDAEALRDMLLYSEVKDSIYGSVPDVSTKEKTMLLSWMVSNCEGLARNQVFEEIASYLPGSRVAKYGRCGKSRYARKTPCKSLGAAELQHDPCWMTVWPKSKFYFAAENQRCDGYITEKLQR